MKKYRPKNCDSCAWSYVSHMYDAKLICALMDENTVIEDKNTVPDWCPARADKRLLDDSESTVL